MLPRPYESQMAIMNAGYLPLQSLRTTQRSLSLPCSEDSRMARIPGAVETSWGVIGCPRRHDFRLGARSWILSQGVPNYSRNIFVVFFFSHHAHTLHLLQRRRFICGFILDFFLDIFRIPESPGTTRMLSVSAEPHTRLL